MISGCPDFKNNSKKKIKLNSKFRTKKNNKFSIYCPVLVGEEGFWTKVIHSRTYIVLGMYEEMGLGHFGTIV